MDDGDPGPVARKLLDEHGPPEAWQHSTREAIDAHLRHDAEAAAHWAAVQRELKEIAPRPGAGDLDIYRSARGMVGERGSLEAWRYAMQQGVEAGGDLLKQAYWLGSPTPSMRLPRVKGKEGA